MNFFKVQPSIQSEMVQDIWMKFDTPTNVFKHGWPFLVN